MIKYAAYLSGYAKDIILLKTGRLALISSNYKEFEKIFTNIFSYNLSNEQVTTAILYAVMYESLLGPSNLRRRPRYRPPPRRVLFAPLAARALLALVRRAGLLVAAVARRVSAADGAFLCRPYSVINYLQSTFGKHVIITNKHNLGTAV